MNFHVTTFGCQMNEHDSERMKGMLESLGYAEVADRHDADLILFNTCSIREKADERFVAHLHEARALKRKDPERVIGVGGCWAQSMKDRVFAQFPFVDVAFGPGQVHKLAEFLTSDSLTAQGFFEFEGFTGHLPGKRARDVHAWVQISAGCNMKCSYCIVPSTRGREVSRPFEELVAEVQQLAAEGVREVTLLGQNVNSYGTRLRHVPDCAITTDIIVGFPGETEADFVETLEVVEEVGFDGAFTFIYSPRRDTEAAEFVDEFVPHEVQVERMERLVEAVQRRAKERAQRFVGRTLDVLVEGPSRYDPSQLRGRTTHNKVVNFDGLAAAGEIVPVEIVSATSQSLVGTESLLSRVVA